MKKKKKRQPRTAARRPGGGARERGHDGGGRGSGPSNPPDQAKQWQRALFVNAVVAAHKGTAK